MKITRLSIILLLGILLLAGLACGGEGLTTYHLTTSVEGQGSISPVSGVFTVDDPIALVACPASGWEFDHWEGDINGSGNPFIINMNSNKSVVAYFIEIKHELSGHLNQFPIEPSDRSIGVGTLSFNKTEACLTLHWEPVKDATKYEWEIGTSIEMKVDGGFIYLWPHTKFLKYWNGDADAARFTNCSLIYGCLPPGETFFWHIRIVEPWQSPWTGGWAFITNSQP